MRLNLALAFALNDPPRPEIPADCEPPAPAAGAFGAVRGARRRAGPPTVVGLPPAAFHEDRGETADPRALAPRAMRGLSERLLARRRLSAAEAALLAFQPAVDPRYAATVGRLQGPRPADEPCDHLADWRDRLDFIERWFPEERRAIGRRRRIVAVLEALTERAAERAG